MTAPWNVFFVTALALTTSVDVFAQQEPPVAPGDRVRVTAPTINPDPLVGTLIALGADTCVLEVEDRADPLELPLASVMRLEVSLGKSSNALNGALVGGSIGAGIGLLLSTICWLNSDSQLFGGYGQDCGPKEVAISVAAFGGAGAGIGLLLGATSYTDRWEEVPLDQLRVGLIPQRNGRLGLAVSASIRF